MLESIFIIIAGVYCIQLISLLISTFKKYKKLPDDKLPSISVIVAVRNEEKNIKRCLESLDKLVYPEGKLEVIISNNQSIDNTGTIIDDFIGDKPLFKHLIPSEDTDHLKGKANALAQAIKIATGEIILTTDADCAVPPTWTKTIGSYYQDDVGMVMGFTTQETYNHFSGMQMMDFIYLLTLAAGTMNIGKPVSAIGNNMSYRKSAYQEVGGYETIPFSVTEDFQLLKSIDSLKKYKIIYPLDQEALVVSEPCEDYKTLYRQKKRWGVGGLESDIVGYSLLGTTFLANIGILLSAIFFSFISLTSLVIKVGIDFLVLSIVLKRLKLLDKLKYFLTFELYFIIYVLALPFTMIKSRKVVWKDKIYDGSENQGLISKKSL
ncbi:MAG: glycosyl transferase [bacterium]|nr:MAG: glycosyl transferase [bacterium]